jgi:hypothetical protein
VKPPFFRAVVTDGVSDKVRHDPTIGLPQGSDHIEDMALNPAVQNNCSNF